ncbi:lysis protein [Pantoea agglomerans]|uniref:lysis protein n=1 Tax=Enterobacter agglomerans TaxID=549 RepID=UPI0023B0C8EF|nr:lysis protein [Pantoea agglomerans]
MRKCWLTGVLIAAILALGWAAKHYYDKAVAWRTVAQHAQELTRQQEASITDMQTRQRNVAALDEKYTKELTDAKATINQLHDDVATGKRRLQLNATCEKQSASRTTSMDDAASARLTDSAQQDYFTLRKRIEVAGKQIAGLQHYIKEQCL